MGHVISPFRWEQNTINVSLKELDRPYSRQPEYWCASDSSQSLGLVFCFHLHTTWEWYVTVQGQGTWVITVTHTYTLKLSNIKALIFFSKTMHYKMILSPHLILLTVPKLGIRITIQNSYPRFNRYAGVLWFYTNLNHSPVPKSTKPCCLNVSDNFSMHFSTVLKKARTHWYYLRRVWVFSNSTVLQKSLHHSTTLCAVWKYHQLVWKLSCSGRENPSYSKLMCWTHHLHTTVQPAGHLQQESMLHIHKQTNLILQKPDQYIKVPKTCSRSKKIRLHKHTW